MTITASLTIFWIDERLKYTGDCPEGIQLPKRELGNIWTPIEIYKKKDTATDKINGHTPPRCKKQQAIICP